MNVDTGTFEAITDRLDQLARQVERLERREHERDAVDRLLTGGGGDRGRRKARHLHAIRGES